jgi:hypothetical protein
MFTSTLHDPWSWDAIIARNTGLLKPIVAALFVLLDGAARLSPGVYRRVLRVLRSHCHCRHQCCGKATGGKAWACGPDHIQQGWDITLFL